MSFKVLNSFDSGSAKDAFHTRSATKLIIAQAEEEQTLAHPRYFRQETGQNSQKLKKIISFVNKNRQSGYKENADWFVIALKGDLEISIADK